MNARLRTSILTLSAAAAVIPMAVSGQDLRATEVLDAPPPVSSIVLAADSFFPAPVPVVPDHPFSPVAQLDESEPGSFALGAFVGLLVVLGINSQIADQGDGQPAFFLFPIGVIGGAMIFWSAGIG